MLTTILKNRFEYLSLICIFCVITLGCADKDKYEGLNAYILTPARKHMKISTGEKLYFQAEASGGVPPYEYSWDFGVAAPSSSEKNPGDVVFNWQGAYKVLLTVKDINGNTNTDFVRIIVGEEEK